MFTQHFLERDTELAAIDEAVGRAVSGTGGFIVVEGQAGIGKSHLLNVTLEMGQAAGMQVLTARGSELERDYPYNLALQMFEPHLRKLEASERAALLSGAGELARPLFDGDFGSVADLQAGSLFHGLYWLTSNLCEQRPMLLSIDDAQWGDLQSLEFLVYLLQRVDEMPLLVMITLRSNEPHSHSSVVNRLLDHHFSQTLQLKTLSYEATAFLVRSEMPEADDAFCEGCAAATGGNPLLLRELIVVLRSQGVAPRAESVDQIPYLDYQMITRWIVARLGELPPEAGKLAAAVATLGPGAALSHAAQLVGMNTEIAAEAADHLVRAELVRIEERLDFVHPIVRWSVYATLPQADRHRMHLRAAQIFREEGATADRVALHLRSTPVVGDPWALEMLQKAASDSRARGAPDAAAGYLRRALDEPMDRDTRADLLVELGTLEAMIGEPRAMERLTHALELIEVPERKAMILHDLGRALYMRGDLGNAGSAFRRALSFIEGDETQASLRAQLEAASLTIGLFDLTSRDTTSPEIGAVLQRPLAEPWPTEPGVLATLALARAFVGHSHSEVKELVRRARGAGLLDADVLDHSVFSAARALGAADDVYQERRVLDAALDDARRRGSVMTFATASYLRSWSHYFSGQMADAEADIQHALDSARYGWEMFLPAASAFMCHTLIERGDFEGAAQAIRSVDEKRWSSTTLWAYVLDARGRLLLLQSKPEEALRDLTECGRLMVDEALAPNPAIIPWRSRAALAAARTGDVAHARALAEEEISLARGFGAARPIGMALRAMGEVEGGDGAIDLLRESVEVLSASPSVLEYARSLVYLGGALRRANDIHGARQYLEEGLEISNDLGAVALTKRARKELLGAGVVPQHHTQGGLGVLTPSQRRVVQMAAQGLSNREIAQALFVTVKAVEWHLTRSYSRLGIGSRRELIELINPDKSQA